MNTMNMPGFAAENALYNSGIKYNMPSSTTERISSGVVPQAGVSQAGISLGTITIEPEQCVIRCNWKCGRYGCFPTNCYEMCF